MECNSVYAQTEISLSLSLSLSLTHTRTQTCTHTNIHTQTYTHKDTQTHTHTHAHTNTQTHTGGSMHQSSAGALELLRRGMHPFDLLGIGHLMPKVSGALAKLLTTWHAWYGTNAGGWALGCVHVCMCVCGGGAQVRFCVFLLVGVCVSVCACVCMYGCMVVCMSACKMCVCVCACMRVHACVCVRTRWQPAGQC